MDLFNIIALVAIGVVGGVWNAIAGGATLFTFPALMATGLPPLVANATNYLALLPANAAALPAYRGELREVGRVRLVPLLFFTNLGAALGAVLLLISEPDVFRVLIPFLIFAATLLFATGERLRIALQRRFGSTQGSGIAYAGLFLFSIYGGYFGAGLSIVLLAIAQILGFTEYRLANAIKNLLALSFTCLSVLIFAGGGLIAWPEAGVVMVGSTIGGYVGARLAQRVNPTLIKMGITGFGLVLSVIYFIRVFA